MNSGNRMDKYKWWLTGIFLIVVSWVIYFIKTLYQIKDAKFANEINLVELSGAIFNLVSIFTTIWLGFYVSAVVDKKKQIDRFEKENIIKRIENILIVFEGVSDHFDLSAPQIFIPYPELVGNFKTIRTRTTFIKKTFARYYSQQTGLIGDWDGIITKFQDINDDLTSSPSQVSGTAQSTFVQNDILQMDQQFGRIVKAKVDAVVDEIFKVMMDFNRL